MSQRLQEPIPGKSGTFSGLEYEYLPNGEVIYDGLNVGKLPTNFFSELGIKKFIMPGKIWRARVDYIGGIQPKGEQKGSDILAGFGQRILTTLVLVAGLSLMLSVGIAALIAPKTSAPTSATFVEKLVTAPITLISGNYPSENIARPTFNFGVINWQPQARVTLKDLQVADWVSKAEDMPQFVSDELASLNTTGKLIQRYKMAPMPKITEPWTPPVVVRDVPAGVDTAGNPVPASQVSDGGKPDTLYTTAQNDDTIFVFTVVLNNGQWMPFSGVFHKQKSEWTYADFAIPGVPSLRTKDRPILNPSDIPFAVAKAFPEAVVQLKEQK